MDARARTVSEILHEAAQYQVPLFQRSYSWHKEHWQRLNDDVMALLVAGVRRAVREHSLYGVIMVAEAWTYIPKRARDHTSIQIMYGEMTVSDLNEGDKTEALMVRMESRDGGHLTLIDTIVRDGSAARLADGMALKREQCLKLESYFEGG